MKYASDDEKQAYKDSNYRELIIEFEDGEVIKNDLIYQESMEFLESICEEQNITYGLCNSSCFKIRILDISKRRKDLWFSAYMQTLDFKRKLGEFQVESDELTDDRMYRDIIAYDKMKSTNQVNVTEWYNSLEFPISLKNFRDGLFVFVGVSQKEQELPNDNMLVERTISAEELYFQDVIRCICEINACFGHFNSDGNFEYVFLHDETGALYPAEDLYPSEDLYPDDYVEERLAKSDYYLGSLKYKEYNVKKISQVQIRQEENDVGLIIGSAGNKYVISDNFLVYGKETEELTEIANSFLSKAVFIEYCPAEVQTRARLWIELGDNIQVQTTNSFIMFPVLKRQLTGIIALKDKYQAEGDEFFPEITSNLKRQFLQMKGKTSKISADLEKLNSEFSSFENDVRGNYVTTTEMTSAIEQTAESINQTVSKKITETEKYADSVAETAETNANNATDDKLKEYSTTTEMTSAIEQTAESINQTVSKKVGNDEIISKINQSAEKILISAEVIDVDGVLDVEKLNALLIKAGSVDAENITGETISGKKINGAEINGSTINAGGKSGSYINLYDANDNLIGYMDVLGIHISSILFDIRDSFYIGSDISSPELYLNKSALILGNSNTNHIEVGVNADEGLGIKRIRTGSVIYPWEINNEGQADFKNFRSGSVTITPSAANTPTGVVVNWDSMGGTPEVIATPYTSVPGESVMGVGVMGRSELGCTIYLTRNNVVETNVGYFAHVLV